MWLHRKEKKDETTGHDHTENVSPPSNGDKKKGGGIRKRILHFSGFSHSTNSGMTSSEMKQLEQTKQFLFKQNPAGSLDRSEKESTESSLPSVTSEAIIHPTPTPRTLNHSTDPLMEVTKDVNSTPSTISAVSSVAPEFAFANPKEFNVPGLKLPALAVVQVDEREITLRRNAEGDFGFSIRRAALPDGTTVVFAEPSDSPRSGPPRPSDLLNGLLPGDVLLAVNGRPVNQMKREELLESIHSAGSTVQLRVRVVAELAELCGRISDSDARLQLNGERSTGRVGTSTVFGDIPLIERFWLIHSAGYTACRLLAHESNGRCRIRVADTELLVDSADIDRANPPTDDRRKDIAALTYVNETAAVHLLRQRIGSNLHFTSAGTLSLIHVANANGDEQLGPLSDELIGLFRSCRRSQMPAHIYSTAQHVYRALQTTSKNQSVVFTGVTGSGKSLQLRNFIRYICGCAGWSKLLNYHEIECAIGILEAFGNCATKFNRNASRFLQLINLGFNSTAALCSIKFQLFLLDTERLIQRSEKESTFHVFHYLWNGVDSSIRQQLKLELIDRPFFHSTDDAEERNSTFLEAFLHLLHSGATNNVASRASFVRVQNAQIAAELLGITLDQLSVAVFRGNQQHETSSRFTLTNRTGSEALECFVKALYNELFLAIGNQFNYVLGKHSSTLFINLLYTPGSNFFVGNKSKTSTYVHDLSDLLYNYVNERVAELFYKCSFDVPAEVYAQEQTNVKVEKPMQTPESITRLLDLKQQLLNSADVERRSEEPRGILFLLEEESMYPGAQEASLLERIFIHTENNRLIRRAPRGKLQFILGHANGLAPTTYSVDGWLKRAQPSYANSTVSQLLQNSKLRLTKSWELGEFFGGFFSNIAVQLDHVFNTIERTQRVQFVHCIQSHHPAQSTANSSEVLDVGYVRNQMRSYLLIDSIRASNHGYPERLPFRDFRRRYQCLLPAGTQTSLSDALEDDRSAVQRILEHSEISDHRCRLGLSQVLLRTDVLLELDDRRDLCLSGLIVSLQQQCRRKLAATWLERRRIQEQAVRCIQRNAEVYFRLKEWPWWKLYQRVHPLLKQATNDEAERKMREQIKRLEESMAELQSEKNRISNQLEETEALFNAECRTSQSLTVSLERESEARVQLEAEIRSLKQNLQRREQEELDDIRSQHQRRIRTYEEQVTDLNETVANLQGQLRSFEQRSRQFETQSQNSFESNTHDYKREYRKTLALLKDAQNLLSMERQKSDKTPMLRRLQRQLEMVEEEKLSAIRSKSTLESELAEMNVEIETIRSGKAALEKRVSTLLQEKSDAVNNARDIEEQLNSALRDYNNHLLQTETNNLTVQRQAETIAELETEKQRLALQLGELESKNSHFHSHYVEAHKITLLESKVRELQSRVEYERCEKQKYETNVNRLQDEVDRLEDRLNDLQRLVSKYEDEVKRQKLAVLAEQEKVQDTKKRYEEMDYKFRKTRDLLEETTETCESLRSDLLLSNRRIESLQAALNTGLDNEEESSDLDDELNDLDESGSAVTATTGSIVIQTSPRAMSTTQESENGVFNESTA
ncbi:hypothetical protein M3Y94_00968700 [Aphelenchoides besseyi]|nr:hypothetical protein M3Y94_00968700 [Aphelenchoides besseyi]